MQWWAKTWFIYKTADRCTGSPSDCSDAVKMLLRLGGLLCLLGAISPLVRSEMFTALVHMEGLVKLEGELASELRGYIRREKDRLRELER